MLNKSYEYFSNVVLDILPDRGYSHLKCLGYSMFYKSLRRTHADESLLSDDAYTKSQVMSSILISGGGESYGLQRCIPGVDGGSIF